ncbi:MAG: hypothetical protein A2406_01390 [Candidatus Komeilibacteria bacterium RIFOXYC1_FULL_37_11]|uniref:Uncharacterized protein n=1 Tax=Candidatus Komeilibacteria bacterium RIFOXYC1_FULL_37_11 TaxID=1798555 RepID=A0A1G2C0Z4_9BACT|nr:MAG: hypothetical protein A2406_01390 [Candidatus Komeilibacteria bacterium RIFOXYC1_FULL_37_11]OGY96017.1 MAG: hypothetical protein A2611_04380 [Candidatus Komeilibacteria bacterium RIFOXYD1_FULL_37_29]
MKQLTLELLFWKILSDVWGSVTAIFFLLTFFKVYDLSHILSDVTIIYLSILSIFTGIKELNRWKNKQFLSRYHGEVFIILWTILMLGFILLSAYDKSHYKISTEFTATYLSVLGIFAISRKSKNLKLR